MLIGTIKADLNQVAVKLELVDVEEVLLNVRDVFSFNEVVVFGGKLSLAGGGVVTGFKLILIGCSLPVSQFIKVDAAMLPYKVAHTTCDTDHYLKIWLDLLKNEVEA